MSIPIDKLYHYIESVAQDIRGDDIVIYRFYPHGSKKLEDLARLRFGNNIDNATNPNIYCNDQEPLDYQYYTTAANTAEVRPSVKLLNKYNIPCIDRNFIKHGTIYDSSLLLHSEQRSINLELYRQNNYIPVYYWSHAIIALDWYRFAQYEKLNKNIKKQFLIYNRAWSGTREYRLKFIDLLISYNLVDKCQVPFNAIEPQLGIHYTNYSFTNNKWRPDHNLEYYIPTKTEVASSASADYEIEDYNATEFEVVLETLFDDDRLQLTEKILRPIALGQPFILAATHGSLEYLRSYGFRTFGTIIDESYDLIEDPRERLEAVVRAMKEITLWSDQEREEKMAIVNKIAAYNRKHFFSGKFFNQVTDELRTNLKAGLTQLEDTNTAADFFRVRTQLSKFEEGRVFLTTYESRQNLIKILTRAREYYNKR